MCQMGLETGDLHLNLRGQIGLQTKKICVIPCKCNGFLNCLEF